MTRIPLSQRLTHEDAATVMVRLILVQLQDYFTALARQDGDEYYSDVYHGIVRETLEGLPFDTNSDDTTVLDTVVTAMSLPREERAKLLFHIMIEPFL